VFDEITNDLFYDDDGNNKEENNSSFPLPDNQGHWYSQLSVTQVATGQELPPKQTQPKTPVLQSKKKSRGNRQLQRYRTKLRKKGFDKAAIEQLINQQQQEPCVTDDNMEIAMPLKDQVR
jgi:hypothetical protein